MAGAQSCEHETLPDLSLQFEPCAHFRSQLLNACAERLVDERVLNKPAVVGGALSHSEREENARLFLDAARAHGCFLGDASPTDIAERKVSIRMPCLRRALRRDPFAKAVHPINCTSPSVVSPTGAGDGCGGLSVGSCTARPPEGTHPPWLLW